MKRVTVSVSETYDVLIDKDLMINAGAYVAKHCPSSTAVVVSDTNVWPLYGEKLEMSLVNHGIKVLHFVFPAGESSKNSATYLDILNFLAENKITRTDVLIALGGGVVGDITGFSAATYLRGIQYIQIPTSLLAMVDSSVGGKTAIDLPAGKNLVGAFKQPSIVLCDTMALDTLSKDLFIDGCAEVIKYGVLYDKELISYLMEVGLDFDRESVIAKCISLKSAVVAQDEFDTGVRQKLNLGHTIAHGIEASSHFQISHGKAVAAGMAMIAKSAAAQMLCTNDVYDRIVAILMRFHLPVHTDFTAPQLFESALSDKKRSGCTVNLIVPRDIGKCDIVPLPVDQVQSFIEAGL